MRSGLPLGGFLLLVFGWFGRYSFAVLCGFWVFMVYDLRLVLGFLVFCGGFLVWFYIADCVICLFLEF